MMKLASHILDVLRAGTPGDLTPDEAKEVARYIDALEFLDAVPEQLGTLLRAVGGLGKIIERAAEKNIEAARFHNLDQRVV